MIAVTILESFSGLKKSHFLNPRNVSAEKVSFDDDMFILDNAYVTMPTSVYGLMMVSRTRQEAGIVTWIGIYGPVQTDRAKRIGDYFGVGAWFLNLSVDGGDIVPYLDELFGLLIQKQSEPRYRDLSLSYVTHSELTPSGRDLFSFDADDVEFLNTGGLKPGGEESACFVEINKDEIVKTFADAVTVVQRHPATARFNRAFLFRDGAIRRALTPLVKPVEWNAGSDEPTETMADRSTPGEHSSSRSDYSGEMTQKRDGIDGRAISTKHDIHHANVRTFGLFNALLAGVNTLLLLLLCGGVFYGPLGWFKDTGGHQTHGVVPGTTEQDGGMVDQGRKNSPQPGSSSRPQSQARFDCLGGHTTRSESAISGSLAEPSTNNTDALAGCLRVILTATTAAAELAAEIDPSVKDQGLKRFLDQTKEGAASLIDHAPLKPGAAGQKPN